MANDNQVKLELDLDLKDSSLREAKQKLDALARDYEQSFKKRKQALASGGRYSPGFMLADDELKRSTQNVEAAKNHFLKAQSDFESKSRPVTKRVAGWFHKILYGEKVQSGEDAEKEQRRLTRQMVGFQQKLHGTLALSSALAQTLSPLPGGGVLHAGLAGATGGFASGVGAYRQQMAAAGQTGTRLGAGLHGLWGGVKGMGVSAGLTLLAKGVAGAVQGSQEDENLFRSLTRAGAGTGLGRAGTHLALGTRGLLAPEAAGVIGGVYRAGGGTEAARAALRAQVSMGMGGEFTQMLGGLANVGVKGGQQAIDSNAKRLWTDVIAAGYDKALGRIDSRKVTAGIMGAMQMLGRQTLGTLAGDPGEIFKMQRFLGQSEAFTGQRGFEMMGRLDSFVKGESSPLARAVSLMQSGLGTPGVGMVESMRRSEQGLFGGEGAEGVSKVTDFVERFMKMGGGDRDITSLLMSQTGGMSVSAATELFDLVKSGSFTDKEFQEAKKKAMPLEQRAYEAMASMNWQSINELLQGINSVLGLILTDSGGLKGVITVLQEVRDALLRVEKFITGVKTAIKEEGPLGAAFGVVTGQTAERQKRNEEFEAAMTRTVGPGWKQAKWGGTSQAALQGPTQALYDKIGLSREKGRERYFEVEDKDKKHHIVVELRDLQGNLLALEELQMGAQQSAQPPQVRAKRP